MEALRYPAAQLFMERAAASGYDAELRDTDAPIAARICRRLDGIALAIELAASSRRPPWDSWNRGAARQPLQPALARPPYRAAAA